ncbi:histidinol-phosphate transaminase [Halosimplex amylolyticum]|uniref:histidinol-phosphate transaminase n=1 Tax=Halosimplex amylolyticum TaxID=3396616 RepID=UPI003F54D019
MEPRDLSAHAVYRAGRGIEEVARELGLDPDDLVKLSSNENPFGASPKAVDAVREHADRVASYPKTSHTDLTAKIAERHGVDDEQIWLTPSGDTALDYLARAFIDPGQRVLVPKPGFAYYPMSARYHHGEVDEYRLEKDDDFAQTPETVLDAYDGHRIVYVTSPHNPTGSEMALDDVRTVAEETDDQTLVVYDEAYIHFSDSPSAVDLVEERDDVAVVRTFSKAYGLAGMRLGYAVTPETWADAYARVNTPFSVTELTCRAGLAALDDDEHVEKTVETAKWAREYMHENLDAETWESGGNFVLVEVGDASAVADAAQRRGVIVRDCSSFGLPECIRITCGTREQTRRAVETVNEVVAEVSA